MPTPSPALVGGTCPSKPRPVLTPTGARMKAAALSKTRSASGPRAASRSGCFLGRTKTRPSVFSPFVPGAKWAFEFSVENSRCYPLYSLMSVAMTRVTELYQPTGPRRNAELDLRHVRDASQGRAEKPDLPPITEVSLPRCAPDAIANGQIGRRQRRDHRRPPPNSLLR